MEHEREDTLRSGRIMVLLIVLALAPARIQAQDAPPSLAVDGEVALSSLIALSDMHLQKTADVLAILASTDAVRSADWERMQVPFAEAVRTNVPAVHWFALPDGTYWTVGHGLAEANLADRPYFPRVLNGETIMGDLVVSRSTGMCAAIVAVPVWSENNEVAGVLAASVYLDSLSQQISREMHLKPNQVFYSLNSEPLVGLHNESGYIFVRPMDEEDPQLERAIREMLSRDEGVASYSFRGRERTMLYRKSPVTGWWYAFGIEKD